jgi:TPR repeat protein
LGISYREGIIIEKDLDKAILMFKKAIKRSKEENNIDTLIAGYENLGVLYENYIEPSNYQKAFKYYELSTKFNSSSGLNNFGTLYHNSRGVERSFETARYYYERSALQGILLNFKSGGDVCLRNLKILYDHNLIKREDSFKWATVYDLPIVIYII